MKDFNTYLKEIGEVGYVESIIHSVFYINGLPGAKLNELVLAEGGQIGIVQGVLPDLIEIMLFQGEGLTHNMRVVRTNEIFQMPVSDSFLGRIINPFGTVLDDQGPIKGDLVYYPIDPRAPLSACQGIAPCFLPPLPVRGLF